MPASEFQTFGNLVKICLGMSVLTIPIATYDAGFISTIILGTISVIWIVFSLKRLLSCLDDCLIAPKEGEDPYFILIEKAIPKYGVWLLNFMYVVTLYGAVVAYVMTWDQLLSGFEWDVWGFPLGKSSYFWAAIFFIIAAPLSCIRSLSSLSFVSQIGNVMLLASMVLVMVYGGVTYGFHYDNAMWLPRNPLSIANIFGILCVNLAVAFIGASSKVSMKDPSKFDLVLSLSLSLCLLFYILFGSFSVITYSSEGATIKDNILESIPSTSIYYMIASLGIALTCCVSYPIAVYPAAVAIQSWVKTEETHFFVTDWRRIICRVGALAVDCLLAIFFTSILTVFSFDILLITLISLLGCFAVTTVSFIFPPFIHLRIKMYASKWDKAFDIILIILGVGIMVSATVCSVIA
ncbi:hypothetical protein WA158_002539 [Blastocystis sp. Blastoise]